MSAPPGGMHNLTTLLKRLEAVTSRLEDVAVHQSTGPQAPRSPTTSTTGSVPAPDSGSSIPPPPAPPAAPSAQGSREGDAYQELIDGPAQDFLTQAQAIGGIVAEHSALVAPMLNAQKAFIELASNSAQPGQKEFGELLGPQGQAIQAVMEAKDKLGRTKDGREWGACLSVVAEGIPAWGWVQIEKTPAPYVLEMKNASQFWVDRVQKQFKETKPEVVAWAKSFVTLIDALHAYVKQYHTTGVKWNPKLASASALSSAPPPPPAPASSSSTTATPTKAAGGGQSALLASLNKGGDITSGLKKVDKSQMTHKNPELRQTSAVPEKKSPPEVKAKPGALARQPSQVAKKPAKTELEGGNKWSVEYHEDNKDITVSDTELSHVVHIFGCVRSVVKISGKINAITMVNCKKTAVVLDSAVSSLSITNSPGFEVQINGTVPTIQIDNNDGGQVYLSQECMDRVEIITSKTSALNISVPTGEGGDYEERPVPEQMKSVIRNGKLVTEIVEHAG